MLFYPQVTHQIAGNTAGATAPIQSGTYVLAGGNNITLSQAGNSVTISGGAGGAGDGGNVLAAGTRTAGSTSTVLFSNANGLTFGLNAVNGSVMTASHDGLTTAMASNRGSDFVQANAAFAGTSASGTIASNGISVSIGPYLTTAALSNHSHGNPTLNLTNLSGTTASNSAGLTLSLSAAAPGGGGAVTFSAGAASAALGSLVFSNSNGVSFGLNGSTITGTVQTNYLTTAALSDHSHGNPTLALTNLSGTTASASNGLTLSLSAAAPGGGADKTISFVEIADGGRFTTCALWNNATYSRRPIFVPFQAEHALESCNTIRIFASRTGGTVLLATFAAGIYTRANSTSMNLVSSTSFSASLSTSAQFSGVRIYDFTGLSGLSLSPGGYVLGLLMSYGATVSGGLNIMGGDNMALAGFVRGGTTTAATASNSGILPFWGVFNATSAGLPSAVAMSSISGGNGVNSPDIYGIIKAI